jgi:cytochrome b subunit of formate dehydrogenase
MSPNRVRWAVHASHALLSLGLIATGLLIQWPGLRQTVVGGYGLQIARIHTWVGFAFILLPALLVSPFMRPIFRDLVRRLGPPDGVTWHKVHILLTLILSVLLAVSGIAVWPTLDLEIRWFDIALEVHIWVTWVFIASLLLHLVVARRRMGAAIRGLFGGAPDPGLEFLLTEEED